MNFSGVVFSDALEMKAIADHFSIQEVVLKGANAGIDLLAICENPDLQNRAIDALTSAVATILKGMMAGATSNSPPPAPTASTNP